MRAVHDVARLHRHHDDAPVVADATARRIALWVLCLCALTTAIDITITNVALPSIGSELHASTSALQWVVDSYNIAPGSTVMMNGLPPEEARDGSSFSMVSRFVGAAVGVAIVGRCSRRRTPHTCPDADGPPPTTGVLGSTARGQRSPTRRPRGTWSSRAARPWRLVAGLALRDVGRAPRP